jgi:hypothetical protein
MIVSPINIQYFTKIERVPENRGAGVRPAPLFSGLSSLFRDLPILVFGKKVVDPGEKLFELD